MADAAGSEFDALRERLAERYALARRTCVIGGQPFDLLVVADPDAVLQQVAEKAAAGGDPLCDEQPYWAELWRASHALCERIAARDMAGADVMDLGCGLGLTTAVLAAAGATVTAVDVSADALSFCRLNTWSHRDRVKTVQTDWRYDRLPRRFELIVAADILYDRDHWPFVDAFWREHTNDDGTIVVSEPGRHSADHFLDWIVARGWHADEEVFVRHEAGESAGESHRMRFYEISRQAREPMWLSGVK